MLCAALEADCFFTFEPSSKKKSTLDGPENNHVDIT